MGERKLGEGWWNRKKRNEVTWGSCSLGVCCGSKASLLLSGLFFGISLFFTVLSKYPVPEGDFEGSDMPLFSGFVPAAHAFGWNLKEIWQVGKSGFVTMFMPCCRGICISESKKCFYHIFLYILFIPLFSWVKHLPQVFVLPLMFWVLSVEANYGYNTCVSDTSLPNYIWS